jgi:ABC-type transport system substrate-binding protein
VRRAITAIGALALVVLALAPSGAARPAAASGPLRLTVGTLGRIGSLDPRRGDSEIAQEVWNLQYPTLTTLDPKTLDPAPGVASGWSPTADGNGWIYNLRRGLTWSDGQPVTADDVVYSITRALEARWPYPSGMLNAITAVRARNDHSVEVTSNGASDVGPSLLVHVVPAHVFSKIPDLDADLTHLGVADGPWHVVAKSADSVEMNATAPTGGPTLFQIVFRTFANDGSLIDALARKEVDVASGLPDTDLGKLEALDQVTVNHASGGSQYILRDTIPDVDIRQAISLAVDRAQLVSQAVNGVGTPGVVPVIARGATWALDPTTVQSLTTALDAQPDRARRLVRDFGPLGEKVVVAPQGASATDVRVAALVRGDLDAVGIPTMTGVEGAKTGRKPDVLIELNRAGADRNIVGDSGLGALDEWRCRDCPGFGHPTHAPPKDFTSQIAYARSTLQGFTTQADVVGLFEPDTLQAFRTDNVSGFLRDPEIRSLVVFGPTVAQYGQLTAALPPPGEQLSNTVYWVGAVIVLVLCVAAFLFAAWIRRRFVPSKETYEG